MEDVVDLIFGTNDAFLELEPFLMKLSDSSLLRAMAPRILPRGFYMDAKNLFHAVVAVSANLYREMSDIFLEHVNTKTPINL